MPAQHQRRRVGVHLRFFRWESERSTTDDVLDLDKFRMALKGYHATLERVGGIRTDARFREFVSVGQQVLGDLEVDEAGKLVKVLSWLQADRLRADSEAGPRRSSGTP